MADILSQKEINALLDVIEEIPEKNLNNNNFEKNLNNNILFLKNILKDEELVISKSQLEVIKNKLNDDNYDKDSLNDYINNLMDPKDIKISRVNLENIYNSLIEINDRNNSNNKIDLLKDELVGTIEALIGEAPNLSLIDYNYNYININKSISPESNYFKLGINTSLGIIYLELNNNLLSNLSNLMMGEEIDYITNKITEDDIDAVNEIFNCYIGALFNTLNNLPVFHNNNLKIIKITEVSKYKNYLLSGKVKNYKSINYLFELNNLSSKVEISFPNDFLEELNKLS